MSNLPSVITQQQSDMITLLINGENITDIANRIDVHRSTIYNWMSREDIKAELNRRRQALTHQGNAIILKDINTYINNVKALANDSSDKRVALAANQYLINRIYGNPTSTIDIGDKDADNTSTEVNMIEVAIGKLKNRHKNK